MKWNEMHVIQIGIVLTNFLIWNLADVYVLHDLILKGALFHALMPSLINVCLDSSEKLRTVKTSFEIDLIALESGPDSRLEMLNGWSSSLTAFHISDNLICAFIWFTDIMLNLVRREAVLTQSLILDPFNNLNILFWDSCRSFSSLGVESESSHVIFTHSWSPYRIFELNKLSAIFLRPVGRRWFFMFTHMHRRLSRWKQLGG